MEINAKNIVLKNIGLSDADNLFEVVGDPEVTKYMSMDPFPSAEYTRNCIERWMTKENDPGFYAYGVFEKSTGNLAGMINTCGLHHGNPVIGYCLGKKYWNKGYMTEALKAFDEKLFADGYEMLVIGAVDANIGSNEVIKKAGFGFVGSETEPLCDTKPEPLLTNEYRLLKPSKVIEGIRTTEESLEALLSVSEAFSDHLTKHRDETLRDMYDLNQFTYEEVPEKQEIEAAIAYQKNRGDDFIKFEGRRALPKSLNDAFSLEEDCELAMLLTSGNISDWTKNTLLEYRNLKEDDIAEDLKSIELNNYGELYGTDFTKRKMDHWICKAKEDNGLNFHAAYLDKKIAGSLYAFRCGDYLMIDGLVVEQWARNQYVATSLLAECIRKEGGIPFLHADADDTPKLMYLKLGFSLADYKYCYFRDGIR